MCRPRPSVTGDFSASTRRQRQPDEREGHSGRRRVQRDQTAQDASRAISFPRAVSINYGSNILSVYPAPQHLPGRHARYNYTSQASSTAPRREDILRIDYNIDDRTRLSGRVIHNWSTVIQTCYGGAFNMSFNFPLASVGQTVTPTNTVAHPDPYVQPDPYQRAHRRVLPQRLPIDAGGSQAVAVHLPASISAVLL